MCNTIFPDRCWTGWNNQHFSYTEGKTKYCPKVSSAKQIKEHGERKSNQHIECYPGNYQEYTGGGVRDLENIAALCRKLLGI